MNTFKLIKEYFAIHKFDQIAILLIIILFLSKPFLFDLYTKYFTATKIFEPSEQFLAFKQDYEKPKEYFNKSTKTKTYSKPKKVAEQFKFNPNTASETDLKKLGINNFAISNIKKYLANNGKYKSKKHFESVYGIEKDFERLKPYIDLPEESISVASYKKPKEKKSFKYFKKEKVKPIILQPFNPNNLTTLQWKETGISDYAINKIENYLKTGARFKIKNDLKKIYGIENDFERLKPFIDLPNEIAFTKTETKSYKESYKTSYTKKEKEVIVIDINLATIDDYKKLYGIGEVISDRIVKFRNKLGGFYKIEQVTEVYGIDNELFTTIKPNLTLGSFTIKKIDINNATEEELKAHSYINWKLASHLVKLRNSKGSFKNVTDLRESYFINEELFNKLAPYIEIKERR